MTIRSVPWRERGLGACCYLGLLPWLRLFPRRRESLFVAHHYRQSAIIVGALLLLVALLALAMLILSYLLVFHREFYESVRMEGYVFGALRKLFLAWAVFWAFGLGMALLGGMRLMPLVQRMAEKDWAVNAAVTGVIGLYALGLTIIPLAIHASSLVPEDRTAGAVYMVYEDNGIFPRWLFALAFYPMARTAKSLYGEEGPVLLHISRENVARALARGKLVFIGSHGTRKGLMLKNDWLLPQDLAVVPKSDALKFVYLTGCDSGDQREAWVSALAPADVVTYDRLSASLEHAWWLWFRGPDKIRAMHAEEQHGHGS